MGTCGSWKREPAGSMEPGTDGTRGRVPPGARLSLLPAGQVFSQHPYAESFIGKPHVWTVDYNNSEEFEAAIKAIMRSQVRFRASQPTGPCLRSPV